MAERQKRADVVIVGAGVMGCAAAWELARRGLSVVVLEKSVPGAEASSAAAGILGAQVEASGPGPMSKLSLASRSRFPRWAESLADATGIDIELRRVGVLKIGLDRKSSAALAEDAVWQKAAGLSVQRVPPKRVRELEPAIGRNAGGVFFPDDARVDPRRFLRALHIAALRAGASFKSGVNVRTVVTRAGRATGVALEGGEVMAAKHVVVAAGSWTSQVQGLDLAKDTVRPARGQIVELLSPAPVLERVVFGPRCYLVPRDDGRTLVGSTLEFVGYRREVTAGAVRELLDAAICIVPTLRHAALNDAWSNFRPHTADELPLVGPTAIRGLTLATGHYRNGILLAPITAEIVSAVVRGKKPPISLEPFSPGRSRG